MCLDSQANPFRATALSLLITRLFYLAPNVSVLPLCTCSLLRFVFSHNIGWAKLVYDSKTHYSVDDIRVPMRINPASLQHIVYVLGERDFSSCHALTAIRFGWNTNSKLSLVDSRVITRIMCDIFVLITAQIVSWFLPYINLSDSRISHGIWYPCNYNLVTRCVIILVVSFGIKTSNSCDQHRLTLYTWGLITLLLF